MKQRFLQRDVLSAFFLFLCLFFLFTLSYTIYHTAQGVWTSHEKFGWACTTFSSAGTTLVVGIALRERRRRNA